MRKPLLWTTLAAAAMTLGAPAATARADDPVRVSVYMDYQITVGASGSPGKTVFAFVTGLGHNVTVSFDTARMAGVATVTLPSECRSDSGKTTCPVPETSDWIQYAIPVHITPIGAAGASGTINVSVAVNGSPAVSTQSAVTLADGVDLVAANLPTDTVHPGQRIFAPLGFVNAGNRAANGITLTVMVRNGLKPFDYDGCDYAPLGTGTMVTCRFDDVVEPGDALQWVTIDKDGTKTPGFGIDVAADAYGETRFMYSVNPGSGDAFATKLRSRRAGSGKHITLSRVMRPRRAATEIASGDNGATTFYRVVNTYDLAATGATATGKAGDTVKVQVGLRNNGPASLDPDRSIAGTTVAAFTFNVPPGVTVTALNHGCMPVNSQGQGGSLGEPGAPRYACETATHIAPNTTFVVTFELKINAVIPNATGTVTVDQIEHPSPDTKPGNDKATVVINPTSTGGAGGGAGGGSGTGAGAGAGTAGSAGNGLPVTGPQAAVLAAGGVVLLLAGAVLYRVARRRRVVLVTDQDL
jgi:hypothetical protein